MADDKDLAEMLDRLVAVHAKMEAGAGGAVIGGLLCEAGELVRDIKSAICDLQEETVGGGEPWCTEYLSPLDAARTLITYFRDQPPSQMESVLAAIRVGSDNDLCLHLGRL